MDNIGIFIISICIINYLIFHISLYFLFKKAEVNTIYSFIPFVSLYHFMKIIRTNPVWIFIPGFNVIVFIVCPILVGYHFNQPYWIRFFGMLCPTLFYPYVALSPKATYIHRKISQLNLKSYTDIDKLENKIKNDVLIYDDESIPNKKKKKLTKKNLKKVEENLKTNFVDDLDMKLGQMQATDVVVTDEDLINPIKPTIDNKEAIINRENIILDYDYDEVENLSSNDTFEDISNNKENVDLNELKSIEKNAIESNKQEYVDNANYKEFEGQKKSVESIAFNIDEKDLKDDKKITVLESKNKVQDLKCPRCGSSLIGFHDYCPGCGLDIRDLVKEQ